MFIRDSFNFILALLVCLPLFICQSIEAQEVLQTTSGQNVLVNKDGSWSILQQDESLNDQGEVIQNGATSLDAFEAPNQGKYPLTIDQRSKVDLLLKSFRSDEAQLLVNTLFFEKSLEDFENKKKMAEKSNDKPLVKTLNKKIESARKSIKTNKRAYTMSTELIVLSQDLINGKVKNKEKTLTQLTKSQEMPKLTASGMGGILDDIEDVAKSLEKPKKPTPKSSEKYPTMFNIDKEDRTNSYDCQIAFDGYDNTIKEKRKEVKTEFFFGYSQDKMKAYFKSDDFIKCDANVSKIGKNYFLTLELRIKSKDAKKTYGMLRANENIRLELVDGNKIYCANMIQDNGTIEPYTGNTLFTGIYKIEKEDLGKLKKKYLDNIGIIWSSGYEQYNIFNVDFLINQIACLEN